MHFDDYDDDYLRFIHSLTEKNQHKMTFVQCWIKLIQSNSLEKTTSRLLAAIYFVEQLNYSFAAE